MSARKEYFQTLLNLFEQHIEATDERKEYELEEQILTFIEENNKKSNEELKKRFFINVYPEPNTGCWLWGGVVTDGYGVMSWKKKLLRMHRLSFKLHNGVIPKGLGVLHKCDEPSCVNPDHLFIGTPKDNSQDMVNKGRQARGSKGGRAKLTEKDVLKIRELKLTGITHKALGKMYGLTKEGIGLIINRKNWRHI